MENHKAALLKSWVQVPNHSDFTIYNLPFGIFKNKRLSPRVGIAIGDKIVDLSALQEAGFFHDIKLGDDVFLQDSLNPFIALGRSTTKKVREKVQYLLREENSDLKDHQSRGKIMLGLKEAEMMRPVKIGDCTAFISPSEQALLVNETGSDTFEKQLVPVESQRRASTIIPSGTSLHRPKGITRTGNNPVIALGSSGQLDFELELAFVAGKSTRMGENISVEDAEDYIFGLVLFNDWTARDIQVAVNDPLMSLSGKNFASSVSPWVVTIDALEPFKTASFEHGPGLLPYLQTKADRGFDIQLEAYIQPEKGTESLVCQTNFKHAYWNAPQLLAHQTVNGSNVEVGDVWTSGAFSSPIEGHYSSLIELLRYTAEGLGGDFIQDGDTVIVKGFCEKEGFRIGFGEITTRILPAK